MGSDFIDNIKKSTEFEFICEFSESDLPINPDIFNDIYSSVAETLKAEVFLGGIAIYDKNGNQIIVIARNTKISEDYGTISDIVSQMNPTIFFEALSDQIVQDGLGHMKFDYFEIQFARIKSPHYVSYFIVDHVKGMYDILDRLFLQMQDLFKDMPQMKTETSNETSSSKEHTPAPTISSPTPTLTPEVEISTQIVDQRTRLTPTPTITEEETEPLSFMKKSIGKISENKTDAQEELEGTKDEEGVQQKSKKHQTISELRDQLKDKLNELKD